MKQELAEDPREAPQPGREARPARADGVAPDAAWRALLDGASAPYGGAHQLSTAITPACPFDSVQKHNSTAQDLCTPGSPPVLGPAWKFLAGS